MFEYSKFSSNYFSKDVEKNISTMQPVIIVLIKFRNSQFLMKMTMIGNDSNFVSRSSIANK